MGCAKVSCIVLCWFVLFRVALQSFHVLRYCFVCGCVVTCVGVTCCDVFDLRCGV